jgi:heterodisulfide reductase subunit A-like polyferredoxin
MAINSIHQKRAEVDMEIQARRYRRHEVYKARREIFKAREESYKARESRIEYICDLCDEKCPFEYIRRTKEHVHLCRDCHKYISAIPEGILKDSLMRFLMGNVI